ncbi:hypothetical protein ICW77_001658 [Listeria monocytogenes]|nr:hypothetical protein [Listeria monocytogenes]
MIEKEQKNYLLEKVEAYCQKWNAFEADIFEQQGKEEAELRKEFPGVDFHYAKRTDWFKNFASLITPLFDEYCTDKHRAYVDVKQHSFGFPVKFNGVEDSVETNVELKNKNRAEVYIKTKTNFDDEYLFVLLRKADEWKIASYKNKRYRSEKWQNKLL